MAAWSIVRGKKGRFVYCHVFALTKVKMVSLPILTFCFIKLIIRNIEKYTTNKSARMYRRSAPPLGPSWLGGGAGRPPSRAVAKSRGGQIRLWVDLASLFYLPLFGLSFSTVLQSWHHHGGGAGRFAPGVPSVGVRLWRHGSVHGCTRLLLSLEVAEAVGVCCCLSAVCVVGLGYN
jgi:hypothetical protein